MKHRGSPGAHNKCSVLAIVISSIQINLGPSTVTKGHNVSRQGDGCEKVRMMGIRESREEGKQFVLCFPQGVSSETHGRGNVMRSLEEDLRRSQDCFTRIKITAWGIRLGLK